MDIGIYGTRQLTAKTVFGDQTEELSKRIVFFQTDGEETILRLSDYNRLARLYGQKEYELEKNEYLVLCNMDNMLELRNPLLAERPAVILDNKAYVPRYDQCQDGFMQMMTTSTNMGIYLFPDEAVPDAWRRYGFLAADYAAEGMEETERADAAVNRIPRESGLSYDTRSDIASASIGLTTIVTFIAIYLGIIFLITGAAILALKELSESSDNRERYQVLRKIGTDEKMIHRSLLKQIGAFFFLPLALASVHSVFGLQFVRKILYNMGHMNSFASILSTAGILIVIYGGYFLTTYLGSKRIIRGKQE